MITRDSQYPYDRPKLSKSIDSSFESIKLRDEAHFQAHQLNIFLNEEVDHIDFEKRQVHTKSGKLFDYDRLVIATGLRPADSPVKPLRGVFTIRSYDDTVAIRTYFTKLTHTLGNSRKANVVLVGGSFISLELASCFAGKANVTVMARRGPFENILGSQVSKKIQKFHESKGVKFFINSKFNIAGFDRGRSGSIETMRLRDDSKWQVDLVILAIGSKPTTEFLINTPIKLTANNYIKVNKAMQTNIQDVYAAGDIVYFPRSCLPGMDFKVNSARSSSNTDDLVNIGHWGVASSHGRVAAQAIIESDQTTPVNDRPASLKVVPFFWSTQYGKAIRFAGLSENFDQVGEKYTFK